MKKIFLFFMIIVLITFSALAGESETDETVHIRAGLLKYVENKIEFSKGTTIYKEENTVTAPRGIYYKEEKRIVLEGGVSLKHNDGDIEAEIMEAWLEEDKYIFKDQVDLLQRLDSGKEFSLSSPYLELYMDDNSFKANRGVTIKYDNRLLKSERVIYNPEDEILELSENAHIQEDNGDWIRSSKVIFYLDTGDFTADGDVELEIQLTDSSK